MKNNEPKLGINTDFAMLKSVDFFKQLNTEAQMKLRLKYKKSKSLF